MGSQMDFSGIKSFFAILIGSILQVIGVVQTPVASISPVLQSPTPIVTTTVFATTQPTIRPTPVTESIQKTVYTHSPDADLGANGFTVSGGQNSITTGSGIAHLKVHGTFTVNAYVWNYGTGIAANIPYVYYDNDQIIKKGTIDHLAPGAETTIQVSFDSATYSGLHTHRFVINPDRSLIEKTYTTNTMQNPWSVEPF